MADEKPVEYETCIKVLTIDANLMAEVDALKKEGWEQSPEFPPVAFYCIRRPRKEQTGDMTAMGKMLIDDSKVWVQPAAANGGGDKSN